MASRRTSGGIRIVVTALAMAVTYVFVRVLGIGGYRSGQPLAVAVLLCVVGGVALLVTREIEDSADRAIWLAAVAVVAITLGIQAASVAPFSRGRLRADLDHLNIPFFKPTATEASGHSWCRPTCPVVARTYAAPPTSTASTMATVLGALKRQHLISPATTAGAQNAMQSGAATVRTHDLIITVRVGDRRTVAREIKPLVVTIQLSAKRR